MEGLLQDLDSFDDLVALLEHETVVGRDIGLALNAVDEDGVDELVGLEFHIGRERGSA